MALINCPECGKIISNQSDKCANCGYPMHANKTKSINCNFRADKTNYPIFSNKDKANRMLILDYCICIPLLILSFSVSGLMQYVVLILMVVISFSLTFVQSYIEIFPTYIKGRTVLGKKFTIKINEIVNVTLGNEQIKIYLPTTNYSVNCGNYGEKIVAFINASSSNS